MRTEGTYEIHHVYKDHLGSWTTITNAGGVVEREQSFDAWGNPRNPETWSGEYISPPMFDRGFTGHEHLHMFGLINMNGRVYDPVMSTFLSPDNYVQAPDNSQNFNRYAYCLDNPLKYTDPSGESIVLAAVVGAFWGAAFSMAMNFDNIRTDADFVNTLTLGALGGAVGGAAGFVAGGAVAGVLGTEGAIPGFLTSASGGFAGGFAGTSVTSWCTGSSFGDGLMAGLKAGAISGLTAGLIGAHNGAIDAINAGGEMWWGEKAIIAEHGTGQKYHGTETKAKINAKRYDKSSKYIDDVKRIKSRMKGIKAFDDWKSMVSGNIDTRSMNENYGMTDDQLSYVNLKKDKSIVDGFVSKRGRLRPKYDVHYAPGVVNYDDITFEAVVGHELIHSTHYIQFGKNMDVGQSERVAYQFTIDVYRRAGMESMALKNDIFAKKYLDLIPNPLYTSPF